MRKHAAAGAGGGGGGRGSGAGGAVGWSAWSSVPADTVFAICCRVAPLRVAATRVLASVQLLREKIVLLGTLTNPDLDVFLREVENSFFCTSTNFSKFVKGIARYLHPALPLTSRTSWSYTPATAELHERAAER